MMNAEMKLRTIGCCVSDIVSSGAPLAEELARFTSSEYVVLPGFCDVHVHFREPGFRNGRQGLCQRRLYCSVHHAEPKSGTG